jgi:hypothetical protein
LYDFVNRTLSQAVIKIAEGRVTTIARIAAIDEPDWIKLDLKKQSLDFEKTPKELEFLFLFCKSQH